MNQQAEKGGEGENGDGVQVSETAQQAVGETGAPPGRQEGSGGMMMRALGVFVRQREATVFVVAVALFLYFAIDKGSSFTSKANLVTLFSESAAPIVIIALGEVMLLICGEIDLSVGFVVGFAPFFMHYLIDFYHFPGLLAILLALLLGVVVGWINGFFTVTIGVPSFITTLGSGFVLMGLTNYTSHDQPANVPQQVLGIGKWLEGYAWAWIAWAVVLAAVFHVVLTRTRWGLHTVSVGGNQLGAREAGIHVNRIKYGNFMITGLLGSLVGLQTMYFTNNIAPTAGSYQPMFYAVTAAVIGGTAMLGGSGTILGAFIGAMVLGILLDGFPLIGVSADTLFIVFGAAILVAMVLNVQLARLRERGQR
jgi:simple sugar transport system permease protein